MSPILVSEHLASPLAEPQPCEDQGPCLGAWCGCVAANKDASDCLLGIVIRQRQRPVRVATQG